MTYEVTIHTGERAIIRPLRLEDIPLLMRPAGAVDPHWQALRWLGEDESPRGHVDCVAWLDRGRLFLPADGQGGANDFDERGPQNEYVRPVTDTEGRVLEEARINGHWYDAATGERAVSRTSAPLWSHRTGALGEGNIELREVAEE